MPSGWRLLARRVKADLIVAGLTVGVALTSEGNGIESAVRSFRNLENREGLDFTSSGTKIGPPVARRLDTNGTGRPACQRP